MEVAPKARRIADGWVSRFAPGRGQSLIVALINGFVGTGEPQWGRHLAVCAQISIPVGREVIWYSSLQLRHL